MDGAGTFQPTPLDDVREEGLRLVRVGRQRKLPIRLIGGVAVWARCPSARLPGLSRDYGDVDVLCLSAARHELKRFFQEMGYVPDEFFNALHGKQRLNFMDPERERPLDVLLDAFRMCHRIDLRHRLDLEEMTIPLADLLLTKLQVVRLNTKDVKDLIALLADHPLAGTGREVIDISRLSSVLGSDWGFEHTVRLNLDRLSSLVNDYELPDEKRTLVKERVEGIVNALNDGQKSARWRMRAAVGERVRWYELPEDVRH